MWTDVDNLDLLLAAFRVGFQQTTVLQVRRGSTVVYDNLRVVDGSVSDKAQDGVRRSINCTVPNETGLYAALQPTGVTLHPSLVLTLTDGTPAATVPMGVFELERVNVGLSGEEQVLALSGQDRWVRVQRAKFMRPEQSRFGQPVTQEIARLVNDVFGAGLPVLSYTKTYATVGSLVWEDKRDEAINALAASIGCYVSFNRIGQCEIRDLPVLTTTPVWTVDAGAMGVLLSGERTVDRARTYNVVSVFNDKADSFGPAYNTVRVWDSDPASPTYAGPDPLAKPDLAGPFGIAPLTLNMPSATTEAAALQAARGVLAKTVGLARQLSVQAARNPLLDAYDVIDVIAPADGERVPQVRERHIVDAVTHPLTAEGSQAITGRSTRTDEFS